MHISDVSAEFDVPVLGTGAAGLTAAVRAAVCGARVAVFEKHESVSGTSAYSGGMIWVPANPYRPPHRADGREDCPAMIFGYLAGRDISRRLATSGTQTGAMEESIA